MLMVDDGFVSFRQYDVLQQLERLYPQWGHLFQTTREVSRDPFSAEADPEGFSEDAIAFLPTLTKSRGMLTSTLERRCLSMPNNGMGLPGQLKETQEALRHGLWPERALATYGQGCPAFPPSDGAQTADLRVSDACIL